MKQKYSLGQLDGKQKDNKEDAIEKLGIILSFIKIIKSFSNLFT